MGVDDRDGGSCWPVADLDGSDGDIEGVGDISAGIVVEADEIDVGAAEVDTDVACAYAFRPTHAETASMPSTGDATATFHRLFLTAMSTTSTAPSANSGIRSAIACSTAGCRRANAYGTDNVEVLGIMCFFPYRGGAGGRRSRGEPGVGAGMQGRSRRDLPRPGKGCWLAVRCWGAQRGLGEPCRERPADPVLAGAVPAAVVSAVVRWLTASAAVVHGASGHEPTHRRAQGGVRGAGEGDGGGQTGVAAAYFGDLGAEALTQLGGQRWKLVGVHGVQRGAGRSGAPAHVGDVDDDAGLPGPAQGHEPDEPVAPLVATAPWASMMAQGGCAVSCSQCKPLCSSSTTSVVGASRLVSAGGAVMVIVGSSSPRIRRRRSRVRG